MEKSWNLKKKLKKSWKNHGICEIICVFDCLFSGYWWFKFLLLFQIACLVHNRAFEWNVKATLNHLTYQILNLQGELYKTGIQAGPTIYTFLFSYFSLHFNENALLLSSLIARQWVGLQTLWRFLLKDLSFDEMVGAWCFGCCQAHQVLPVGFLLLRYSFLCAVESLSLLYLLFISWFLCSWRWCVDKLGVFHTNQNLCVLIHIWT